ncbi:MAG: NAD-dependent epimerase/dehydratase family protein [Deltaproteobacteria bacterium]|nr:NAD-dependent epimerase/dehydratase family protein [Deltaproteobacteria bacterium]MBW2182138.1 NAD-dependent epimerase/dehydratase family protein [Deltaproteobacteria bacterium]
MSNHTPEKVLVTGGGGFLGKAIVRKLIERGDRVSSFSRSSYYELKSLGVTQIQGDISDFEAVERACNGVDLVFHAAAKPGISGKYSEYYQTNFKGTKNIIESCKRHGVSRLVHTSSPSVIFDGMDMEGIDESAPYPVTYHASYPKTKALAEKEVLKSINDELKAIILRPHLIWGPEDNHLIPGIIQRAHRLRIIGHGKNKVDTIYIENAADAHILAADRLKESPGLSGNIYFISQDEPVLLWEMINNILKAAHLPKIEKSIPKNIAWAIGAVMEFVYKTLSLSSEPPMTRFVANELATSHWFDISAAKQDLGYQPIISTAEGLQRLEVWLQTNKQGIGIKHGTH